MGDRPKHSAEPWRSDEIEDYNSAKTDEERRMMMWSFGYDDAHNYDFERLFPADSSILPSEKPPREEPNWARRGVWIAVLAIAVTVLIFFLTLFFQAIGFPKTIP